MRFIENKSGIPFSFKGALLAACVMAPALGWAGSFTAPDVSGPYRLAFLTSDFIAATSSDIATYNNFVTQEAALNGSLPSTSWTAIASTASTDAVTNTACSVAGCASDPIYLVDGTELATSLANFFADNLLATNGISVDQNGNSLVGYAWTGSNSDGTADAGATLGTSSPEFGMTGFSNGMSQSNFFPASSTDGVYALSAPIRGTTSVPEPGSAALLVTGALALAASRRRRGATAA